MTYNVTRFKKGRIDVYLGTVKARSYKEAARKAFDKWDNDGKEQYLQIIPVRS